MRLLPLLFFFNDTATTEIYTLSLHDALPISLRRRGAGELGLQLVGEIAVVVFEQPDRRLAAALLGDALQQLRERLLVGTREQVLSIRTQPIRERGCTDTALLATVGNQRLGFELLEMMADRVDGHAQLVGKLFRR